MKTISILIIILSFSQCGSAKIENKAPFKIASATYNNWVGGVPGVSGTRVEIKLTEKEDIVFDSLFFQNKKTKVEISEEKKVTVLRGFFNTSTKKNVDFILHSDAKKELKNTVPKQEKFPFELKQNEAIISYKINNKTKFYKIENINEVKSALFPKIQ